MSHCVTYRSPYEFDENFGKDDPRSWPRMCCKRIPLGEGVTVERVGQYARDVPLGAIEGIRWQQNGVRLLASLRPSGRVDITVSAARTFFGREKRETFVLFPHGKCKHLPCPPELKRYVLEVFAAIREQVQAEAAERLAAHVRFPRS